MQLNYQNSIDEHLVDGSNTLFLFFGGIAGAIGMPPFEFYKAANILNSSKIFIRDLNQAWYQRGIPGLGSDAISIAKYLENRIAESRASRVCLVGNSMGGFAALLFCSMLRQGHVIAFAPQTFVNNEKRILHGDNRWPSQIEKLHASRRESDVYELNPWISKIHPEIEAQIFVSASDKLDEAHAAELSTYKNINIISRSDGGHELVKALRDEGMLSKILAGNN